jgi:hypothetical protein
MARRRKPINFDLINSGDSKECLRVLEDLTRSRPYGASQQLKDSHYKDNPYSYSSRDWNSWILESAFAGEETGQWNSDTTGWFGYTDEQLYQVALMLGCSGTSASDWDIRSGLRMKADWYGKKNTMRGTKLVPRLQKAYKRWIENPSISEKVIQVQIRQDHRGSTYEQRDWSYNPSVFFRACGEEDAKLVFRTLFSHVWPETDDKYRGGILEANFIQMGDESATVSGNTETIQDLKKRLAKMQEEKERTENIMEELQAGIEALELFNISQFA